MDWYYGHDRPGPQSMNRVYDKPGRYGLEIALSLSLNDELAI